MIRVFSEEPEGRGWEDEGVVEGWAREREAVGCEGDDEDEGAEEEEEGAGAGMLEVEVVGRAGLESVSGSEEGESMENIGDFPVCE